MLARRRAAPATFAVLTVVAGCGGSEEPAQDRFDAGRAFADVEDQVAIGPRPSDSPGSREEVALIESELRNAGVRDVGVQHPYANVVGTIPGSEPGAVVVGAHHDTKDAIPGFV